ncbi:MAG: NAD(P)/FAD-dependent oxidoreductase [Nostocoides sp.]
MPFAHTPSTHATAAVGDAQPLPFWLDSPHRPEPAPALEEHTTADLLIIGGGYTGLWTALQAAEADPARDIVLLEGNTCGSAASGRNGGFVSASLTHGLANGVEKFPAEIDTLVRLGHDNLVGIEATISAYGIDCSFEKTGELDIATERWQASELAEYAELGARHGEEIHLLDADQTRARLNTPLALAGTWSPECALVDPARLAWGLRRACLTRGVRIHEHTPVTELEDDGARVIAHTQSGRTVTAPRVALGTNAFPPLLKRIRAYVVPVYDYALMTTPLTAEQLAAIGWAGREGVGDAGNHFHYLRLTEDNRMLFGGYDAIYHRGNGFGPSMEQRPETFALLATHFAQMFPRLADVRFSHAWGGAIDTCTRFSAMWGRAMGGKIAYAVGYTGLGVGATRFGAAVMLDLLDGATTQRTSLAMVRTKPVPFPPEPLRSLGIGWTTRALHSADDNDGHRGLWLRTLDRLGLGFDS